MVQTIMADGLIRFLALGGWWAHTLLAKRVRILTREGIEIPGVIGAKPPHFLSEAEREKVMKIEDMFIDVGARDAGEAQCFRHPARRRHRSGQPFCADAQPGPAALEGFR